MAVRMVAGARGGSHLGGGFLQTESSSWAALLGSWEKSCAWFSWGIWGLGAVRAPVGRASPSWAPGSYSPGGPGVSVVGGEAEVPVCVCTRVGACLCARVSVH